MKTTYKPERHDFYLKNEIVQLAFRAGKKAGLTRIYGIDRHAAFPCDSVQQAMKEAHQDALQQRIDGAINALEASQNQKQATLTLTKLLLDTNSVAELTTNKSFYLDKLNRAGTVTNFVGPYLVSEWYRRNLYMYSIVQKTIASTDARVMVLVGNGHAAMLRDFVAYDTAFKLKPLQEILKN